MKEFRVVFSNQPLAYREAIAAAVGSLRPEIEVICSDPGDLDSEILRVNPQLVIGSDLPESLRSRLSSWIMLYPDGLNLAQCCILGEERQFAGVDLANILSMVDDLAAHSGMIAAPEADPLYGAAPAV